MPRGLIGLSLALLMLVAMVPSGPIGAQSPPSGNPLLGERAAPAESRAERPAGERAATGPGGFVGRALVQFQREANRRIGQHMRAIRDGDTRAPLFVGLGLAFLYGMVHAAGPGHGKLVVVSYFLAREARIGRGLLMGAQIAICHVLSAMVIVLLADLLMRQAFGLPPEEVRGVRLASYGLIVLIGGVMLVQAVRRSIRGRDHVHDAHCGCHASGRQQGLLALGVGLVPCTGAMLILLYSLANGLLAAGLMLVAMIAAGMALTMGALGLASVVARRYVAERAAGGGTLSLRLTALLDYGGGIAIVTLGLLLLASA